MLSRFLGMCVFLQLGICFFLFFSATRSGKSYIWEKIEIEGGSHKLSLFSPTFLPKNVEIYNSVIVSSDRAVQRLISPTTTLTYTPVNFHATIFPFCLKPGGQFTARQFLVSCQSILTKKGYRRCLLCYKFTSLLMIIICSFKILYMCFDSC